MNQRTFLHVFLIAALCFSQLAANVHMVGHFQHSPDVNFPAYTLSQVEPHPHAAHRHGHHALAELAREARTKKYHSIVEHTGNSTHDNDSKSDCAIYHAYLGQNGCHYATTTGFPIDTRSIAVAFIVSTSVASPTPHHYPIRGPPHS